MEIKLKLIEDEMKGVIRNNNMLRGIIKEIEESVTNKTKISLPSLINADQVLSEITEREARKKMSSYLICQKIKDSQKDKSGCREIPKTLDHQIKSIPKLVPLGKQTSNDARSRAINI